MWQLGTTSPADDRATTAENCRACARALLAALEDLRFTRPEEVQGLI
jgi:hypothetical protein